MSELLFFALILVSAGFCFWPYFRKQSVEALSSRDTPLGRVQQRKDTLLQNIADLDFEYRMGKLAEEDYQNLRGTLKSQAAEAIEQIDVLAETETLLGRAPHGATRRAPTGASTPVASSTDTARCESCGAALAPQARFCSSCGHKMA